jgi:lauroyl/myristoyl acyltransferase
MLSRDRQRLRPACCTGCSCRRGARIALINLRLCFPELSEAERRALAKRHFAITGRSMLERGLAWWASAERMRAHGAHRRPRTARRR